MIISTKQCEIAAGRVTADAEYKTVGDKNTPVAKFSVVGMDKTDDTPTKFVNVVAWFDLAHYAKDIKKGDRVLVAGVIKNADWTNKTTGELVKKNELVADFIQIQMHGENKSSDFTASSETVNEEDVPF